MYYFIITGILCIVLLIAFLLIDSFKVNYEIQLFILNTKEEILLIYDAKQGRFNLPILKVAFDEIATHVLCKYMQDEYKDVKWCFDARFHKENRKFDRIRDDYGPAYVFDKNEQWRKKAILCYVLKVDENTFHEYISKQAPFPAFYMWSDICEMGVDIQPDKETKDMIRKVLE